MTHTAPAPAAVAAPSCAKGPKLERPKIALEASNEDWNAFCRRWDAFRKGTGIDNTTASSQLLECATDGLMNIVLRASPTFVSLPIDDALKVLKSLAVVPVALGVLRSDLASLRQDPDEPFRAYAARVQGKAETCEFKVSFNGSCAKCHAPFTGEVYYVDEVIRDVLLNGIADIDIRRDALATEDIHRKSVNELIAFIESRETARNANPSSSILGLSSYRRSTKSAAATSFSTKPQIQEKRHFMPSASDRARTAFCPDCGMTFHLFTELRRGWNTKPHERCAACWKTWKNDRRSSSNTPNDRPMMSNAISVDSETFGQLTSIGLQQSQRQHKRHKPITLVHHVFTASEWRRAKVREHPRITLSLTPDFDHCQQATYIDAVVDSGAQSNVWSMKAFLDAGYSRHDLSPVTLALGAANKSRIRIQGAFVTRISSTAPTGKTIHCRAVVYVSEDVDDFFMSYETMIDLGIVGPEFPTVGAATSASDDSTEREVLITASSTIKPSVQVVRLLDDGCSNSRDGSSCGCPQRQLPPTPPTKLPFECIPENNEKMKQWLLARYDESTFNTCHHRPLPCMAAPQ